MNDSVIDINASLKSEKLVFKNLFLLRNFNKFVLIPFLIFVNFFSISFLFSRIENQEPIGIAVFYFLITLISIPITLFLIFDLYSLKRIYGNSYEENVQTIKDVSEKYNWEIDSCNLKMARINFSWKDSGSTFGYREMIVLFDKKDILVNCTAYSYRSIPILLNWFGNVDKVNKLKNEFNKRLKNTLQHRI